MSVPFAPFRRAESAVRLAIHGTTPRNCRPGNPLRRLAASRFGEETAGRSSEVLARIADPDRLAEVGDRIVRSETGGEFLARVREVWKPDEAGEQP